MVGEAEDRGYCPSLGDCGDCLSSLKVSISRRYRLANAPDAVSTAEQILVCAVVVALAGRTPGSCSLALVCLDDLPIVCCCRRVFFLLKFSVMDDRRARSLRRDQSVRVFRAFACLFLFVRRTFLISHLEAPSGRPFPARQGRPGRERRSRRDPSRPNRSPLRLSLSSPPYLKQACESQQLPTSQPTNPPPPPAGSSSLAPSPALSPPLPPPAVPPPSPSTSNAVPPAPPTCSASSLSR